MKNFTRSLHDAKKYWLSLLLASFCSLSVAALWGANIGAFYPILEVTIRGKSVDTWFQEQLSTQQQHVDELQQKIQAYEQTVAATTNNSEREKLERKLSDSRTELNDANQRLATYTSAYPWVQKLIPQDPFKTIVMIVVVLMASTLIKHGFTIVSDALVGRVALDLSRDIRQQLFHRALHSDRAEFTKQGASTFQSQITHTTDLVCTGLMAIFGSAIREPLKLLSCLIGAAWICPRLLMMSMIVAPLLGSFLYLITRKIRTNTRRVLSRVSDYHAVMVESLGNVQTIQAYQMEQHEESRFAQSTLTVRKYGLRCIILSSLSKPVIEFLGVAMLGTTIVGGAYLVLNNQTTLLGITVCSEPLSVSALLVFFGMLIGASDPLRRLSAVYSQVYTGIVASESIYNMIDRPSAIVDPVEPQPLPKRHKVLKLTNVDFGYKSDNMILKDVSLEIPFGKTVAIVGHNGSGKSTLINLLCRFYDPLSGAISMDGVDFRNAKVGEIRSKIALVNQQTELFNDTVAYNIRYGKPTATDDEVYSAAEEAHASEFIESALPAKYQTVVGVNGQKLSGGQRQRIALARALLRDPEILILDEATSQIDMRSEQLIRQSLAKHRGERTMIIITHREKLLELADVVFEVRNGQLVEVSRHELESNNQRQVA